MNGEDYVGVGIGVGLGSILVAFGVSIGIVTYMGGKGNVARLELEKARVERGVEVREVHLNEFDKPLNERTPEKYIEVDGERFFLEIDGKRVEDFLGE